MDMNPSDKINPVKEAEPVNIFYEIAGITGHVVCPLNKMRFAEAAYAQNGEQFRKKGDSLGSSIALYESLMTAIPLRVENGYKITLV